MVNMQMGENIISAYESEYAGHDLNSLPIMKGIRNYGEIDAVVLLTGYVGMPEIWINVGKTKFGKDVGLGMTAVSAADYFHRSRTDRSPRRVRRVRNSHAGRCRRYRCRPISIDSLAEGW